MVCLGKLDGITREMGFDAALQAAREQGALPILAHPHWTGNSFDDAVRWPFDGVEVYNHVCHWLNGKGDGGAYWNAMLRRRPDTLGFAVDDAHLRPEHPGWNGGWIVVNAAERTPEPSHGGHPPRATSTLPADRSFARSIRRGHVEIETSPVQFIRLVGPASRGERLGSFDDQRLTGARFAAPTEWDYAYLEIEDDRAPGVDEHAVRGKAAMTTVIASGSFDNLRSRHVRFLEEAAKLGELHVLLWSDDVRRRLKAERRSFPRPSVNT